MVLDTASVRLFVLAADLGNFTRVAEVAGTVQPAVSQRIRQLEGVLGRQLLERTPRFVRLTESGQIFLPKARALLAAHDEASRFDEASPMRFALGASDHALGDGLEGVIRRLRAALPPSAAIEIRLGMSPEMRVLFDDGVLDAIVIRRETGGGEGVVLGKDPLGWRALPGIVTAFDVLPLATLGEPCGVRASAIKRLDDARRPWREVFTGRSCSTVAAAVRAGLGIAPMGAIVSRGLIDVGPLLKLPPLPGSEIVLLARASSPETVAAIRALEAAVRVLLSTR